MLKLLRQVGDLPPQRLLPLLLLCQLALQGLQPLLHHVCRLILGGALQWAGAALRNCSMAQRSVAASRLQQMQQWWQSRVAAAGPDQQRYLLQAVHCTCTAFDQKLG